MSHHLKCQVDNGFANLQICNRDSERDEVGLGMLLVWGFHFVLGELDSHTIEASNMVINACVQFLPSENMTLVRRRGGVLGWLV